jgi:hypothetical protein
MATYKSTNYGKTPVGDRGGDVIVSRFKWAIDVNGYDGSGDSTALVNGDKILVGQLPAGHFLVPELCAGINDGVNTGTGHFSIAVDVDANLVVSNVAMAASTYSKTAAAAGLPAQCEAPTLGISTLNRDVYFILNNVPTAAGGYLIAQIAYAPQSAQEKPVS